MSNLKQNAKNLRNNPTPQEQKMWNLLRKKQFHGLRFLRQYIIGQYIVDFICRSEKIIIEIDGGQHNENINYDSKRTEYLEMLGYKVVRFWNNEIDNNISGVYQKLEELIDTPPNLP